MRTQCSLQLTYSRHYATTKFSLSIDLTHSQIVWCLGFGVFFLPCMGLISQRKLVVLLIFQFTSFIALFYTSTVNVEANLRLNQNALVLIHQLMLENGRVGSRKGRIQFYERAPMYTNIHLIGSYNNIVFKQRFQMTKQLSNMFVNKLGHYLLR